MSKEETGNEAMFNKTNRLTRGEQQEYNENRSLQQNTNESETQQTFR